MLFGEAGLGRKMTRNRAGFFELLTNSHKFTFALNSAFSHSLTTFDMKVFIDGKYYDEGKAMVSVFDHGLLYGDGVFEGIRAYNGRVFKLKEHIDRLFYSAKAILLELPMSHAELMKATVDACRKNKLRDGYIRLVVTRGVGTLGLNPRSCKNPSVIIIAGKIQVYPPELYAKGMDIVTVPTTRNLHSAVNPAIKSLNYLNNILAKIEANNAGVEEAVMLNAEGLWRNARRTTCSSSRMGSCPRRRSQRGRCMASRGAR
jgi:branched-subunit amino acid aminotransferase/4-amino-4-deoxychorismate lyase